jgi:DNA-binding transcriptional LysR family regulator
MNRDISLSDLEVFKAVAEEGSVSAAGRKLHRVQSNVTTRVQLLEESLNTQLFDRSSRRMKLTHSGWLLLDYAQRLFDLVRETREAISMEGPAGLLKFGSLECVASTILPATLARFHREFPMVQLDMQTGNTLALSNEVLKGNLDFAIVADVTKSDQIEVLEIGEEIGCFVSSKSMAPMDVLQQSKAPSLLGFSQGCAFRSALEHWIKESGILPERMGVFGSYAAILGCVTAGMGVALVPKRVIELYAFKDALSIDEYGQKIRFPVQLISKKGAFKTSALEAFVRVVKEDLSIAD